MKNSLVAATVLSAFLGLTLAAQGFNLRTGTWEFSMTMGGEMNFEGVPPAARAQIEAELKKPQIYRSCVNAEDLKNLNLGKKDDGDDEDCTVASSKVTATTADIVRRCTGDEPRTETIHYEASSPQTLRADISSKGATGTMTMAITGKWIAAQCTE
jgi:hypothetical protein